MVEIAAGVPLVWARRDGVGVVVAAVVSSMVSAVALVLVPSSVLPVSPFVAPACDCSSAVS